MAVKTTDFLVTVSMWQFRAGAVALGSGSTIPAGIPTMRVPHSAHDRPLVMVKPPADTR
jgi:hypothetical protein